MNDDVSNVPDGILFDLAKAKAFSEALEKHRREQAARERRESAPRAVTLGYWQDDEQSPTETLVSMLTSHVIVGGRHSDTFQQLLDAITDWHGPITIAPVASERPLSRPGA